MLLFVIIKFFTPSVKAPTSLINTVNLATSTEANTINTPLEPAAPIEQATIITSTATETTKPTTCQAAGGNWSEGYRECENVSADWCRQQGGQFKECESACRHNESQGFCITQCIPVCQL